MWLTQLQKAELFGRDRTVITKHIRNIFTEQELDEESNVHTCIMFLTYTNTHGVVPARLKLFILKSSLIKVKESRDASHQQET